MHSGRKRRRPDNIHREETQNNDDNEVTNGGTEILKRKAGENTEESEGKPFDWFTRGEYFSQHRHEISETASPRIENLIDAAHCRRPPAQEACGDFAMEINTRLWHMPDVPPKPSFLDFLARCTSMKVAQQKASGAKKDEPSSSTRDGFETLNNVCVSTTVENDSSSMDERKVSKQPCPAIIQKNNREESVNEVSGDTEKHKKNDKRKRNEILMDETAAVAIGILAEECLISSFLPLAKEHATRCRQLDRDSDDHETIVSGGMMKDAKTVESKSFVEWMLPPEKAIANLSDFDKNNSGRYPTPKASKGGGLSSSQRPCAESIRLASEHSQDNGNKKYFEAWCGRNNLEPDFVRNNNDFFRSFIGNESAVSSMPSSKEKIARLEEAKKAIRDSIETGSQLGNSESFPIPRIIKTKDDMSRAMVKEEVRGRDGDKNTDMM